MAYYYSEPLRIYIDISIALLTISLAILGIALPYINRLKSKFFLEGVKLENEKKKKTVTEIVAKYNEIEEKEGSITNYHWLLIVNIVILVLFLYFSAAFSVSGTYNCLNMTGCINSPEKNFSPVWSIEEHTTILGLSVAYFFAATPLLLFVVFVLLIYIILGLYKIVNQIGEKERELEIEKIASKTK